jgi:hypothetical protein
MGTLGVGECGGMGWDARCEMLWRLSGTDGFTKEGHGEQGLRVGEGWAHMYRTQD